MGFHVGIPILKLANKVGGNASRKRTGTLRAVACEALEERWSRDPDIDRSRTQYNEYEGIRSGLALTEAMTREAEAYSQKRREAGGRALRDTASLGFVTIVKPDMAAIQAMPPDRRKQFFDDSDEILDGFLGRDNVRARVTHRDELGEHKHIFRMGFNEDGTLSVDSLVNPRIWKQINLEYPKKMREKGWDVEDCDMYDASKADDQAYMEERKAKRKAAGRGSSKYKMDRDKERAAALDAQEADIKARENENEARGAVLDGVKLTQEIIQGDITKKRREAAVTAEQLEAREAAVATREAAVTTREENVEAQEKAIEARRKAVEAREAVLREKTEAIIREATEAATEALERVEAATRRGAAAQAKAREEARDAAERLIMEAAGGQLTQQQKPQEKQGPEF